MTKAKPSTGLSKARYRVKWTRTDGTSVSRRYVVAGGGQSALAKALRDPLAPMLACARVEVWESDYSDESLPLLRLEFPVCLAAYGVEPGRRAALAEVAA